MTVETDLVTLLKTFCERVSPGFADVNTPLPYVTFQQIGGIAPTFVDNTVPSKENAEIQIDVWADSAAVAKALIKQIEAALITSAAVQARPVSAAASDYDADMKRYCSRQDFSIWGDR
jgi:hypothetical protein